MKRLKNYPDFMKGHVKTNDTVLDMGNLLSLKRYMEEKRDFTDCRALESMDKGHWSGVYSYDNYLELLDNGDAKVMKQIKDNTQKAINELGKTYQEELINYRFDVTGQFFDIGLVLTGVPEVWLDPEVQEVEKVKIELILDGTFPDGSDLDVVIKNAGRVLAMSKILEDHGVEVKIRQMLAITRFNTKNNLFVLADVKDYDEPINYVKCSALISPTFLRRAGMKIMEVEAKHSLAAGYGAQYTALDTVKLINTKEIDKLEKRLFKC